MCFLFSFPSSIPLLRSRLGVEHLLALFLILLLVLLALPNTESIVYAPHNTRTLGTTLNRPVCMLSLCNILCLHSDAVAPDHQTIPYEIEGTPPRVLKRKNGRP